MASEPFGRTLIDKIAFGAFLVLTASLAIQKPSLLIVSGLSLTATDFVFPISLVLTATAVLFRKLRIRRSTLYLLFGVYICAFVLATLFSPNIARSAVKVFATVYLVGIAVTASIVLDSEFRLKIVVLTFLAASCIPILIGLLTIVIFYAAPENSLLPYLTYHYGAVPVGNYPRLSSTFVSASMFCNYLNVSLIFLLGAFGRNWISAGCFWVGLSAILITSIFTISAGLGAVFLAVGIWIWYKQPNAAGGRSSFVAGISIFVLSLVVSFVALKPYDTAPYSFHLPFFNVELFPSSRLLVWSDAIKIFFANFFFGNGPGSASASVVFQNSEGTFSYLTDAHNSFLSVATQTGIIGLAAFVALTVYLIKLGFKQPRDEPLRYALAIGFLTAFVFQGLTGSFEDARHLWFLIGVLIAAEMISSKGSAAEVVSST